MAATKDIARQVIESLPREAGSANFRELYCELVNSWVLYENSGPEPVPIESGDDS